MILRCVSTGLVCAMITLAASPAHAEDPPSAVQMTAAARAAAENGNYREAFRLGLAALEAFPESAWDRQDLRRLIQQVSDRWFERMSRADQQAAVAAVTTPPTSPGARAALGFANWFLGNRLRAVAEGIAIVNAYPDSVGADLAIEGIFQTFYYDLDRPGAVATVKMFAKTAPNNPASAWAVCRLTWWSCKKGNVDLALTTNREVAQTSPETRVAAVAADLNLLLDHVQQARYQQAGDQLEKLRPYTPESVIQDILDTFLIGIDWKNTRSPAVADRLAKLDTAMQAMAETASDPIHRDFALCLLGRRYMLEGRNDQAVDSFQKVLDAGRKTLEEFALTRIPRLCRWQYPNRAAALLERYRAGYGKSAGAETNVLMLGDIYLSQREYSKGLAVFDEVEHRRTGGDIMRKSFNLAPRRGKMLCLQALGRQQEAAALAQDLLTESGYGKPVAQLTSAEVSTIAKALKVLGADDEVKVCEAELAHRRLQSAESD